MSFVTFIYRIGSRTYYGKYIFDDVYIDCEEDHLLLDKEIVTGVFNAINRFRLKNNEEKLSLSQIRVGILSFCPNVNVYSSEDEIKAFDFYCICPNLWSTHSKIYINGVMV
jgi:hypothetical protein